MTPVQHDLLYKEQQIKSILKFCIPPFSFLSFKVQKVYQKLISKRFGLAGLQERITSVRLVKVLVHFGRRVLNQFTFISIQNADSLTFKKA